MVQDKLAPNKPWFKIS